MTDDNDESRESIKLDSDESIKYKANITKNIFEMPIFYLACLLVIDMVIDFFKYMHLTTADARINHMFDIFVICLLIYFCVKSINEIKHTDYIITSKRIVIKNSETIISCNKQDVQYINKNKLVCNNIPYKGNCSVRICKKKIWYKDLQTKRYACAAQ